MDRTMVSNFLRRFEAHESIKISRFGSEIHWNLQKVAYTGQLRTHFGHVWVFGWSLGARKGFSTFRRVPSFTLYDPKPVSNDFWSFCKLHLVLAEFAYSVRKNMTKYKEAERWIERNFQSDFDRRKLFLKSSYFIFETGIGYFRPRETLRGHRDTFWKPVSVPTPCVERRTPLQIDRSPSSGGVRQYYCRFGLFSEDTFFL